MYALHICDIKGTIEITGNNYARNASGNIDTHTEYYKIIVSEIITTKYRQRNRSNIKIRCRQTIPGTIDIGNSIATNPAENKIYIHLNRGI